MHGDGFSSRSESLYLLIHPSDFLDQRSLHAGDGGIVVIDCLIARTDDIDGPHQIIQTLGGTERVGQRIDRMGCYIEEAVALRIPALTHYLAEPCILKQLVVIHRLLIYIEVLPSIARRKATRQSLLEYCGLDTLAMVKVWEKLREVSK